MIDVPFETVLREAIDARVAEVHTALPAQIVTYYADTQTADVQPMVKDVYYDTDGNLKVRSFPVLSSVPVAFLRGGGFFVSLPLAKGDTGMLIFSELPIDRWRSSGQEGHPVNARRHGAGNGVFYPGVRPRAQKLDEDGVDDHLVIGKEGGAQVHVKDSEIRAGSAGAIDPVALSSKVDAFIAALDALFRTTWVVVPMDGGAALKAAFAAAFPTPPTSTGATKLKAE